MRASVRHPSLELLVFVTGTASLGSEIAAARLIAPFFGASTIVWANTIAVVLVALSLGYWFGGRLADRHPDGPALYLLVLIAAVLLAIVPLVSGPFLELSVKAFDELSAGAFAGSLFGVLALVAVPVLLLGAVSPWALRLKLAQVEHTGEVAGRLYAISTVGSLAGTFLASLLLIPLLGTQRTFLAFAIALAIVACFGLSRRFVLAPLGIAALMAVPVGTVKAADVPAGARVIVERDTEYQYARVVELADGSRQLELNEGQAIHSLYRPDTVLTDNYWDAFLVDPAAALGRPPRTLAVLGNGAGTMVRAYGKYFPDTRIDAVEIDGELTDLGKKYFGLRDRPGVHFFAEDARPFLRRADDDRYEAIFVDAYRQPYIPFYLSTHEFFDLVRDKLTPGGIVLINVGHPRTSRKLEQVLTATMRTVFAHVVRDPVKQVNTVLMASTAPITAAKLRSAAPGLPRDLRPIATGAAARLQPSLRGGSVYTDDKAPVEWLVDTSIVDYAAGGG